MLKRINILVEIKYQISKMKVMKVDVRGYQAIALLPNEDVCD